MPKLLQSCVDEVKRRATIEEVVPAWGVPLKRKGANLVGLCPFHEEKSGSFTVRPGKGFVCFGCGAKGDAVKFVMQKEGCEFLPAIEKLAEKFGVALQLEEPVRRDPVGLAQGDSAGAESAAAPSGSVLVLPQGIDEKTAKRAMARQARYERERAAESRLEMELLNAWRPGVERRKLWPWSAPVRERFDDDRSLDLSGVRDALTASRGWPGHWVYHLFDEGLIAWPELPWSTDRSVAFKVQAPKGSGGDVRELIPIGYHQRFEIRGDRSWVFVPYLPAEDKRHTEFQREMVAAEMARRPADQLDVAMCPGLPFVMGSPVSVRFLVITEGQWDAVTFAGACGWLECESAWPEGAMVMGVRGANGVDTLLAYWGEWLEATKPSILVLADNDAAGRRWDTPAPLDKTVPGSPLLPTFAEKLLKRPGETKEEPEWISRARKVSVQRVNPAIAVPGGETRAKDFNDYWKAKRPSAASMAKWLRALGFVGEKGEWL